MRDGKTQVVPRASGPMGFEEFSERYRARLVVVSGPDAGTVYPLQNNRQILGRGPGVDLTGANPAMSRQHAALLYRDGSFLVEDLGSTNGVRVRGEDVSEALLGHGDIVEIAGQSFQLLFERREARPNTYEIVVDG